MQLPTKATKGDIVTLLDNARRKISAAKRKHYGNPLVTAESWENDSGARISFHKSKIPALEKAGLMKKPEEYSYGYHMSNKLMTETCTDLSTLELLIDEIWKRLFLKDRDGVFSL